MELMTPQFAQLAFTAVGACWITNQIIVTFSKNKDDRDYYELYRLIFVIISFLAFLQFPVLLAILLLISMAVGVIVILNYIYSKLMPK